MQILVLGVYGNKGKMEVKRWDMISLNVVGSHVEVSRQNHFVALSNVNVNDGDEGDKMDGVVL